MNPDFAKSRFNPYYKNHTAELTRMFAKTQNEFSVAIITPNKTHHSSRINLLSAITLMYNSFVLEDNIKCDDNIKPVISAFYIALDKLNDWEYRNKKD